MNTGKEEEMLIVIDNETANAVFASSFYTAKQLRLMWDVGYTILNAEEVE
jgi:hypothetical protein